MRRERVADALSEIFGIYRMAAWLRGCSFALSAQAKSPALLQMGRGVAIQRGAILHCGGKAWSGYSGGIQLGEGVRIGPYCVLYGAGGVLLGEHVHLGPGVKIMSQAGKHDANRFTTTPSYQFAPVRLGEGCWIGAGAVILGGADLGRGVSVAPNSVVSGKVPDYAVVAGNPARVVFRSEVLEP